MGIDGEDDGILSPKSVGLARGSDGKSGRRMRGTSMSPAVADNKRPKRQSQPTSAESEDDEGVGRSQIEAGSSCG